MESLPLHKIDARFLLAPSRFVPGLEAQRRLNCFRPPDSSKGSHSKRDSATVSKISYNFAIFQKNSCPFSSSKVPSCKCVAGTRLLATSTSPWDCRNIDLTFAQTDDGASQLLYEQSRIDQNFMFGGDFQVYIIASKWVKDGRRAPGLCLVLLSYRICRLLAQS